jgi:hypothetical protein
MKHLKPFHKVFEKESQVASKVAELTEELNNIKDLDAEIQHKESGNGVIIKAELKLNRNLKKLTPESLTAILQKFSGYIESIEYKENMNKIILVLKTFEHKL